MATASNNKGNNKRGKNRPAHIIAAERIGNMGIDDTVNLVDQLVTERPAAAAFLQLQLNNRLNNDSAS